MKQQPQPRKRMGRPPSGRPARKAESVCLSEAERKTAIELGNGLGLSAGVRRALEIAKELRK